jgi:hypothetical protein
VVEDLRLALPEKCMPQFGQSPAAGLTHNGCRHRETAVTYGQDT